MTLGIFVFANANSYGMLLLSQVIIAMGSCTGFVGAGYVGGQWFGMAKFSFMFGLVQVMAALTSAFSVNIFEAILSHVNWRSLFNVYGVLGIILLVLGAIYIRDPRPVAGGMDKGIGEFFTSVVKSMADVAKIGHVWIASIIGAAQFGVMLALGVVWMPKLLMVHGVSQSTAGFGTSMLWLGLAAGSAVVPWWSDHIKGRKLPLILGGAVQLACLLALLYIPQVGSAFAIIFCFIFGFANAAHMLAFSTAADVVSPSQIGTSAAIVNGIMFIVGGIMISRPGVRIGMGIEAGIEPKSLEIARVRQLAPACCARYRSRALILYEGDLSETVRSPKPATAQPHSIAPVSLSAGGSHMAIDVAVKPVELGSARAWFVWALAVTFVVYYFSFQTGYAIVNSRVQQDIGLSVCRSPRWRRCILGSLLYVSF